MEIVYTSEQVEEMLDRTTKNILDYIYIYATASFLIGAVLTGIVITYIASDSREEYVTECNAKLQQAEKYMDIVVNYENKRNVQIIKEGKL